MLHAWGVGEAFGTVAHAVYARTLDSLEYGPRTHTQHTALCARCVHPLQPQTGASMAFELFTHATRFLGRKVVLLGLYNGQGLEGEPEADFVTYSRVDGEVGAGGVVCVWGG